MLCFLFCPGVLLRDSPYYPSFILSFLSTSAAFDLSRPWESLCRGFLVCKKIPFAPASRANLCSSLRAKFPLRLQHDFQFISHVTEDQMLRLNPSTIQLDNRDLEWHVTRHSHRLRTGFSNVSDRSTRRADTSDSQGRRIGVTTPHSWRGEPAVPSRSNRNDSSDKDALVLKYPVPHDSKAFWDRVLAEAVTPVRREAVTPLGGYANHPEEEVLEHENPQKLSLGENSVGVRQSRKFLGEPDKFLAASNIYPLRSGNLSATH